MKFLFTVLITIFLCLEAAAQCPSNDNTSVEIVERGLSSEVHVKFENAIREIREINIIKFGSGIAQNAVIREKNKKELVITELKSGEYMIQIVGNDCTSIVGTDKDYRGFIIK